MILPVDDDTLDAWSRLLGLTKEQTATTLQDVELTLRVGHAHRPDSMRHLTFEELIAGMSVDEMALLFLITGLRVAGHHQAADSVELRGLLAELRSAQPAD